MPDFSNYMIMPRVYWLEKLANHTTRMYIVRGKQASVAVHPKYSVQEFEWFLMYTSPIIWKTSYHVLCMFDHRNYT